MMRGALPVPMGDVAARVLRRLLVDGSPLGAPVVAVMDDAAVLAAARNFFGASVWCAFDGVSVSWHADEPLFVDPRDPDNVDPEEAAERRLRDRTAESASNAT